MIELLGKLIPDFIAKVAFNGGLNSIVDKVSTDPFCDQIWDA